MSQQELEQGDQEVMGVVNGHSHPEAAAAAEEIGKRLGEQNAQSGDTSSVTAGAVPPSPQGEGLGERISPRAALGRNDTEGDECVYKCGPSPEWKRDMEEAEKRCRVRIKRQVIACAVICILVAAALVAAYYIPDILVWIVNLGVLSCGIVAAVKLDRWRRLWAE